MEMAFEAHPLWAGCSEEELESAGEGLEKCVMTKLSSRVFASVPDDVEADKQLSEKIPLIQQFIRPEKLDIKLAFQNETSWLFGSTASFSYRRLSAESFISNIDAKSISMRALNFKEIMELARESLLALSTDLNGLSNQNAGNNSKAELMESKHRALSSKKERDSSVRDPDLLKRHLQGWVVLTHLLLHGDAETLNYHQDTSSVASNNEPHKLSGEPDDEPQIPTDLTDGPNMLSLVCEENVVLKPEKNEAMVTQHEGKDENSQ
ncbi:hypothetical protein D5086_026499 [Populus alba]|uniref:Uncharacterized protein n=1 Tax=Populus alba TaxID=43335 RepID=A0ACC4B2C8_POPAL